MGFEGEFCVIWCSFWRFFLLFVRNCNRFGDDVRGRPRWDRVDIDEMPGRDFALRVQAWGSDSMNPAGRK